MKLVEFAEKNRVTVDTIRVILEDLLDIGMFPEKYKETIQIRPIPENMLLNDDMEIALTEMIKELSNHDTNTLISLNSIAGALDIPFEQVSKALISDPNAGIMINTMQHGKTKDAYCISMCVLERALYLITKKDDEKKQDDPAPAGQSVPKVRNKPRSKKSAYTVFNDILQASLPASEIRKFLLSQKIFTATELATMADTDVETKFREEFVGIPVKTNDEAASDALLVIKREILNDMDVSGLFLIR